MKNLSESENISRFLEEYHDTLKNDYSLSSNVTNNSSSELIAIPESIIETNWTSSSSSPIDDIISVYRVLESEGKYVAQSLFSNRVFTVVETSVGLMAMGLKGTLFTIKYSTISRHFKKDINHNLTEAELRLLPSSLQDPTIRVTPYPCKRKNQYRVQTNLQRNSQKLVVGVSVNNVGYRMFQNEIKTFFFR